MKSCELCKNTARIYCDSDQASLCWTCDAKVHSANFLVAKHSRTLLCHVCQSPTPWNAAGEKLGRTVCACERCCVHRRPNGVDIVRTATVEEQTMDDDKTDSDSDFEEEDDDDEDGDDYSVDLDDGEEEDNQVVPWSSSTPPPPAASSSSSEGSSSGEPDVSSKRMREDVTDLGFYDDTGSSSSKKSNFKQTGGVEGAFVDSLSFRPLKTRKIEANR